jgi:hypothetical protein
VYEALSYYRRASPEALVHEALSYEALSYEALSYEALSYEAFSYCIYTCTTRPLLVYGALSYRYIPVLHVRARRRRP